LAFFSGFVLTVAFFLPPWFIFGFFFGVIFGDPDSLGRFDEFVSVVIYGQKLKRVKSNLLNLD
jgi:hypothetical protein